MKSGMSVATDKVLDVGRAMRLLTSSSVLVGIPMDKERPGEEGDPVTNAQLGYIHEHGSPDNNLPARPFLIPGIKAAHKKIVDQLRDAGRKALEGNAGGVNKALERAGIIGQNSVRAQFVDNDWDELAEATLNKRDPAKRNDDGKVIKRGKSRRERGAVNPLQDTGTMRKSVTYVVEKK
jgi:hypothetical protein